MSGFPRAVLWLAGLITAMLTAATIAGPPPAAAAVSAPALTVPNACKTFSGKSVDAFFGVAKTRHLARKSAHTGTGKNEVWTCTVKHTKTLKVTTSAFSGGFGGPLKCYAHKTLGKDGQVCVSTVKSFVFSIAVFDKHGIFFADSINKIMPKKGKALYTFALAQYKAFKG
jgi:hypothetical protein